MLFSYLTIALRTIARYKVFSSINLLGLTISLTCAIAIGVYIADEYSFDRYHEKVDRIYQVASTINYNGKTMKWSTTPTKVVHILSKDVPEIEKASHLFHHNFGDLAFVSTDKVKSSETHFYWADQELFDILTVPFLAGNASAALTRLNTIVISETSAIKYFGGIQQAIGKTLKIDNELELEVTGVFKNQPSNSQFQFQMLAAFQSNWFGKPQNLTWDNASFQSLVLLLPHASAKNVDEKIEKLLSAHIEKDSRWFTLNLTPLKDLHLYSPDIKVMSGSNESGDIGQIKIVGLLGVVVLLIAAFNYMNLSTAQANRRAKEIGVNKTLGATKNQLAIKFFFETFSFVLLSIITSIILFLALLPVFTHITGKALTGSFLTQPLFWIGIILLLFMLSAVAGFYPALYLSSFSPKRVLKSHSLVGGYPLFRKTLVVLQFSTSVVLIICTIGLYRQLNYIQNKNLGYEPEQVAAVLVTGAENKEQVNNVKNGFESLNGIKKVCKAQAYPGQGGSGRTILPLGGQGNGISITTNRASSEVVDVLNIKLLAGKTLPDKSPGDTTIQVVINKVTADYLGLAPEKAIGVMVDIQGFGGKSEIVGVMEDFHFNSLYQPIDAYCFHNAASEGYNNLLVKMESSNVRETMTSLENTFKAIMPSAFQFTFIDQYLNRLYASDNRLAKIVLTFSSIAILIACLGLYALASFSTEQRTKEIGIRKVMGASVTQLFNQLSMEFIQLVAIGILLAFPTSYYFLDKWMQQFAFRTTISVALFIFTALASLLIAWFTVALKTITATQSNPVKSLRSE
jgi:putative ABC transport system permease protein